MSSVITVRDLDPADRAWLRREASRAGLSMEEYVCRLIREKRENVERRLKPSEVFERHFGPKHGIELSPPKSYRHKPIHEFAAAVDLDGADLEGVLARSGGRESA